MSTRLSSGDLTLRHCLNRVPSPRQRQAAEAIAGAPIRVEMAYKHGQMLEVKVGEGAAG